MTPPPAPPPAMPGHIAVIMDGNGRWAAARGLARVIGHRKGVDATRRLVEAVLARRIPFLTLFCFSSENWNRPEEEVSALLEILRRGLHGEVPELLKEGVRLRVIGDRDALPEDLRGMLETAEQRSRHGDRLLLTLALNYGARREIAAAAKSFAAEVAAGRATPEDLDEEAFARRLLTAGAPDPDLLIRTGGERRVSNFLLWQLAYTEFVFTDTLWPDFRASDLDRALEEFAARERRFGGLGRLAEEGGSGAEDGKIAGKIKSGAGR